MPLSSKKILRSALPILVCIITAFGCGKTTTEPWTSYIPGNTLGVIIPEEGTTVRDFLTESYIPMLDDTSPSAIQLLSTVAEEYPHQIFIEGMLLYPDTSNEWQPVWITNTQQNALSELMQNHQRRFEQNEYEFNGYQIHKMFIADRILFVLPINNQTLFSESSIGLEDIIRTINNQMPAMAIGDNVTRPATIFNTSELETFVNQLTQVTHHPFLTDIFKGASPVQIQVNTDENQPWEWQFSGQSELNGDISPLLELLNAPPEPFSLDRHIPVTSAAFVLFRSDPLQFEPDSIEPATELDQFLLANSQITRDFRRFLGKEAAFVTFAESGPSNSSEYLYLRSLQQSGQTVSLFDELAERGLVVKDGQTYTVISAIIGKLFGSDIFPNQDFYISIFNGVAAISLRKGLAESIGGDAERRRVYYYDDEYRSIRNAFPSSLSSFTYANASQFGRYIQPWLYPQHYLTPLLANFDQIIITTSYNEQLSAMDITLNNFSLDESDQPYREQWVFPLEGEEIVAEPVLADITGTSRKEVIFSTDQGSVYAVAQDGTMVLQISTEPDIPTGSPVIYDWYGNNQPVIMQAAGNKIYAWNQNGQQLPNFPIQLNETISSPLIVTDVTLNGVAEMIVATADRNLHILNSRGQSINGWPQSTNSIVRSSPLVAEIDRQRSVFAFSENTVHSWNINGGRRDGFPLFLPAQLQSSPAIAGNHILGAGLDGSLYAIGSSPLFADSLSRPIMSDSLSIQSLSISNSSLTGSPVYQENTLVRGNDGLTRENTILIQSSNGSVMLYTTLGELIFTESMGQPASASFSPLVTDVNSDQRQDIVAVADFGRLYAWDLLNGQRHRALPTSAMSYPLIADFFENGRMEIIAQTREGLRCWTILFTELESQSAAD